MYLDQPIESLPKTSSITIKKLKNLGIRTYNDLLNYYPFRYENYSLTSNISDLQEGEIATVKAKIIDAKFQITRKGTKLQRFIVTDDTGKMDIVWYNQPYLLKLLTIGQYVSVAGTVKKFSKCFTIEPNSYEILKSYDQDTIHTGRIIPIYPETRGISSRTIREKVWIVLQDMDDDDLPEDLPETIISFNSLISRHLAYRNIHFPQNQSSLHKARNRLAFDELFLAQLSSAVVRKYWEKETVKHHFDIKTNFDEFDKFKDLLPFKLTGAQNRCLDEILADIVKSKPMNRLLQGDVGSGKTIIAALACYLAYLNKYQSAFMAPTEILANQHYQGLAALFKDSKIKVGLQTKSKRVQDEKKTEGYDIVVGTHALLNDKLKFNKLGLAVIDEQHRFGVAQRAVLKEKGLNPHLLTMTATPIPRTITLTIYGELDVSIIDEMPKGRKPIKTYLIPKEKRSACYEWVKKQIASYGDQVFIICPLVEESEEETMQSVKAATIEYEHLKNEVFSQYKVGLIHGKVKSKDKDAIMKDFKEKKYDILVATSVVEVGIDVPNATIMIIEGAERFGLAQLHQLRGRVGRGDKQSYCYLFTDKQDSEVLERLSYFTKNLSGIKLAEYDLKLRGPGDMFGIKQHGYANLKLASLSDYELIKKTRNAVRYFMDRHHDLSKFPVIEKTIERYRKMKIARD